MRRRNLVSLVAAVGLAASMLATPSMADDKRELRVVPHSNLSVLDPIWTTAYITRNYGYMVYDTLFSEDSKGRIRPQMVDTYTSSADLKTWRFKLRPGLKFHDGAKVTSADVVASIKRWGAKDAFGGVLMANVDSFDTPTEDHFVIKLKSPSGIVVDALGKVSSNVPFIMPARLANTPANEQVKEAIGSGPYKFVADEFVSGSKVVFEKFADYAPRTEAADGLAGGKVVNFDRVEWVIIKDAETAVNALRAGEVDMIEQLPFEKYYSVKKMDGIKVEDYSPAGLQYILRFNHTLPPFDNVKVRQAAMMALTQAAFIKIQVGVPELGRLCRSMYPCGTAYADENTGYFTGKAQIKKARAMLKEAGYDGTPIVLMRPTDLSVIAKIPLVAEQQLKQAGFNVKLEQMDWASLVARRAKKDPIGQGGWNIFLTAWNAADIASPLTMAMFNVKAEGKGWFGWQENAEIESLKQKFAATTDMGEKKKIASTIQKIAFDTASHAPLGQYRSPAALRDNVVGLLRTAGPPVFWNMQKK